MENKFKLLIKQLSSNFALLNLINRYQKTHSNTNDHHKNWWSDLTLTQRRNSIESKQFSISIEVDEETFDLENDYSFYKLMLVGYFQGLYPHYTLT